MSLLSEGKVKDQVSEVFLIHQLKTCAEIESREMAVGLSDKVELVARNQLEIMELDKEAVILDSFDTDHYVMVFPHLNYLRVDEILAFVLLACSNALHACLKGHLAVHGVQLVFRVFRVRHRGQVVVWKAVEYAELGCVEGLWISEDH